MICYMNNNDLTEEMVNLVCVAIIGNFSKDDSKSIQKILEYPLGNNENTFNLKSKTGNFSQTKVQFVKLYNYDFGKRY